MPKESRYSKYCKDCGIEIFADVNMVMIKDYLWEQICDKTEDNICDECIEKRMGRNIQMKDFKDTDIGDIEMIPCNALWLANKNKNDRRA